MTDQAEKIVHLAREILDYERSTPCHDIFKESSNTRMISIKTTCLSALVAAIGSASLTFAIDDISRPVTRAEQFEIDALIFYTAREKEITQEELKSEISTALSLKLQDILTAYDFRRARHYLWDRLKG